MRRAASLGGAGHRNGLGRSQTARNLLPRLTRGVELLELTLVELEQHPGPVEIGARASVVGAVEGDDPTECDDGKSRGC
jgi:hypothetical protein